MSLALNSATHGHSLFTASCSQAVASIQREHEFIISVTLQRSLPGTVASTDVCSSGVMVVLKKGMESSCLLMEPGTSHKHRAEEYNRSDGTMGQKQDDGIYWSMALEHCTGAGLRATWGPGYT